MRFLSTLLLLTAAPLLADPYISEFMASNQNSIADEDGAHSDWIEIRNPDPTPVNMAGWALTDEASIPQKWIFPSVTIPANGQIIVFASGKNRTNPAANLHTVFSLAADGEYLALVKPDGITKTTEYSPKFPPQLQDISYGVSSNTTSTTVVDKPTAVRALVPTDDSLGTTWRAKLFDDSTWTAGTFGVGYFTAAANPNLSADLGTNFVAQMQNTTRNSYTRAHFNVSSPGSVVKLMLKMNYDDGFHAWINGQHVANSSNAPAEASLTFSSVVTTGHGPGAFEDFDISAYINKLTAGDNVIALQGINVNNTSSDCFVWPQLIITTDTGGTGLTGYFTTATPGAANAGTDSIFLPINVEFSRASGPFTTAFNLTLSGAGAGQEIRYVMADPTSSPGANIPEPTAASTLYTSSISISTSKLIRAAVFETATGRKGRTTTAQYLLLETAAGSNNTSNFTSNLPIIIVDDHGAGTPVDGAGGAYTTGGIYTFPTVAGVATLNSTPAHFTRAGVRVRGSSSAGFAKKSFGVELWDEQNLDKDLPLLSLPSDSDWVLNGPLIYDDTYIHNSYIYELSRRVGRWAPRTKPVEVFLNQNGGKLDYTDYNGVYILTEKIKSNKNRLEIKQIEPSDVAGEALTGGYVFKIDRADPDEVNWITSTGVPNTESGQRLVLVEPDPQVDTPQQISYIQGYIQTFDTTLSTERNGGFATRNYRNYMDTPTWIDHHVLNALAYNVDALRLSGYFYKDRNHKICAGPIWDFDRALGSDDGRDSNPQSWANITYFFDRDWWGHLFRDPDFVMAWVDRWQQLRTNVFSNANLLALADQQGAEIGNVAGARDAARWPDNAANGGVYLNEITAMKNWLTLRVAWIDGQMPAAPTANVASGIVAPGTMVTLSGVSAIRYTINGTDPRPPGGSTTTGALTYTGPVAINQTTVITARRQLPVTTTVFTGQAAIGTNWSGIITRVYLVNEFFAVAGDIAASEINYHPLNPTAAESTAMPGVETDDFEFVELKNIGNRKVNLFEVKFADTQPFKELVLAPFTLNPGDVAFVVKNRAAFQLRYGTAQSAKIVGEWIDGSLDDSGERIVLTARDGTPIQDFTYGDGDSWPGRADGKGSTLEYSGATFTNADFNSPANWRSSSEFHGSPGVVGTGPDNRVAINELLTNTSLPYLDTIELKNLTAAPIPIGGWYLSNVSNPEDADSYKQYAIPAGTSVPANSYTVFNQTHFNPNGAWNPAHGTPAATEFEFDGNRSGDCWLIEADGTGKLLRFVDHAEFEATRLNESWGRTPDGTGPIYPMVARTCVDEASGLSPKPVLGATNSIQRSGPLLISEVQHSPNGGNTDLEYVEIRNPTAVAQPLANWRLRGDVDFNFTTESIPAGGVLVVVPFPATDLVKANAFRTAYTASNSITLVGPWSLDKHLGITGTVTLYRPETPPVSEPYLIPRTQEDTVTYSSGGAWPVTTTGLSLNRRGGTPPGGTPGSWKSDIPSPGTFGVTLAQWLAANFPGGGLGSLPGDDPDNDGASNALEYSRGTNPSVYENHSPLAPTFVQTTGVNAAFIFTFTRPVDRAGTTYTIQKSTDLLNWTNVADSLINSTGDTETHQIVVPRDGTEPPKLYFRLQIVAP
jgi:hypothetical protein